MEKYEELIEECPDFSAIKLIEICRALLPEEWKKQPYRHPELINGIGLLKSEAAMNAYIAAYAEMHIAKCRVALQNFPFEDLDGSIEIIDWGCGQGIGSLCTIEALAQRDKLMWLKNITLIEPSPNPLKRAIVNIKKLTGNVTNIISVNQYLPATGENNEIEGLSYKNKNVIHIFSNILDVTSINLIKLAKMVANLGRNHFILCMGPMNSYSYRIDQFISIFGIQELFCDLAEKQFGRTSDTLYQYTGKIKCFKYNGQPLNLNADLSTQPDLYNGKVVYSDYDPNIGFINDLVSPFSKKISLLLDASLTEEDIIVLKPNIQGDTPEMVIAEPNRGIIILDTFNEDIEIYEFPKEENSNKDSVRNSNILKNRKTGDEIISPINKISYYQDNLINKHLNGLVDKLIDNSSVLSIVVKIIVFSQNSTKDAREKFKSNRKYTLIFGNDIFDNEEYKKQFIECTRIKKKNAYFDDYVFRSLMQKLTPKWHSYKEGKYIKLTKPQISLSKSAANTKRKISGVAGSGKTQVLVTRAAYSQVRTGGKVLILTYNVSLANYIKYRLGEVRADFAWDKIEVSYYHQFFRTMAYKCNKHVHFNSYEDFSFFAASEMQIQKYEAIFIDEVQDYDAEWLRILFKYFLVENGEFVVFGDPKQNLYHRPTDVNGDMLIGGVIGGTWNHELNESHRFGNPMLEDLFAKFKQAFLPSPEDYKKRPIQIDMNHSIKYANIGRITTFNETKEIAKYCRNICSKFSVEEKEVIVLSQNSDILRDVEYSYRMLTSKKTSTTFLPYELYNKLLDKYIIKDPSTANAIYGFKRDKDNADHERKLKFTMAAEGMKFSTIHSFKGWEADTVILILEPVTNHVEPYSTSTTCNTPELIYTAITRARQNLFIINLGNSTYHSFFSENII